MAVELIPPTIPVSYLAFATTVHLGLAALVNHRCAGSSPVSSKAFVSGLLGGLPWLFPSAPGLAAGFALHGAWVATCGRSRQPTPAPRPPSTSPPPGTGPRTKAAASGGSRPRDFIAVPVLGTFDESPDIRTFRLARPDGFDFQPGQFLTVRLRTDGRDQVRCYSISSPPAAKGYLEISVKRQGVVSSALHAGIRAGSLLFVRPPAGAFVYPGDDDRPLVLIAGGIGITPLMSMVRHATLNDPGRPVVLLYSARSEGDFAFRDELAVLARRNPQVRVCLAVTSGTLRPGLYSGRIDDALLLAAVPDLAHAISMLCGPQTMIDQLSATLGRLGVPPAQIRFERFDAAVAASSKGRPVATTAPPAAGTVQVTAARSSRTVTMSMNQTLLEAAEAHGLGIPSICRAGVCGTCRTKVLEGEVNCASDLLDDDDRAQGYVLACAASVRSDCVIEA